MLTKTPLVAATSVASKNKTRGRVEISLFGDPSRTKIFMLPSATVDRFCVSRMLEFFKNVLLFPFTKVLVENRFKKRFCT